MWIATLKRTIKNYMQTYSKHHTTKMIAVKVFWIFSSNMKSRRSRRLPHLSILLNEADVAPATQEAYIIKGHQKGCIICEEALEEQCDGGHRW